MTRALAFVLALGCGCGCTERPIVADDDGSEIDSESDTGCVALDLPDPRAPIGAPCESSCDCGPELECREGWCGPCPPGNPGCACEAGDVCDVGLACRAGVCR